MTFHYRVVPGVWLLLVVLTAASAIASATSPTPPHNTGPTQPEERIDSTGASSSADQPSFKTRHDRFVAGLDEQIRIKRAESVRMADDIFEKPKYEVRYELVKVALDEIFKTLKRARRTLEAFDLEDYGTIPIDDTEMVESLVFVLENIPFVGDLILRLPDIVHRQIDNHKLRMELLTWGWEVCQASPVFKASKVLAMHLHLLGQEAQIAEEVDPDYQNPFTEANINKNIREKRQEQKLHQKLASKEERRRRLRQPRLSKVEL